MSAEDGSANDQTLQELLGIEDPDELSERERELRQKAQENSRALDIIKDQIKNTHRENALFFESIKHRLTQESKDTIENTDSDDMENELAGYAKNLVTLQLIISILRDNPNYDDISKRLEKVKSFLSTGNQDEDFLDGFEVDGSEYE